MKFPKLGFSSTLLVLTGVALSISTEAAAQTVNPVGQWNRTLLSMVRTPNLQPSTIHSTRNFAMMHLAMEEAVLLFEGLGDNPELLQQAAANAAAHAVLVGLYPSSKTILDQAYQAALAAIPSAPKVARFLEAIATGNRVADRILRDRTNDGSNVPAPT